jgi:hypothetical protein
MASHCKTVEMWSWPLKANSHIPCRSHAAPVPFPCHAVSLEVKIWPSHLIYTGRPCLIHTCHAAPVPFPCPAVSKGTSEGHGTARHGRGRGTAWHVWINIGRLSTACGRPATFGFFRLTGRVSRRLFDDDVGSRLAVRFFPATTRTFTKETAGQGRSTACVN